MCVGFGGPSSAHSEDRSRAGLFVLRQLREDFQVRALEFLAQVPHGRVQPQNQDRQLLLPPHLRTAMHWTDIKHGR